MKNLINQLQKDEGYRQFPYACSRNKITLGYGRNIQEKGLTESEARYLLTKDVIEVIKDLRKIFKDFNQLPTDIQEVLGNMRFQLGSGGFRSFRRFIKAIKKHNWNKAAIEMKDSRWYDQTKDRAKRLIKKVKHV